MTKTSAMLSWNDRFALIDHFKPTDDTICAAFRLTADELETARQLRAAGMFSTSRNMDFSQYSEVFTNVVADTRPEPTRVVSLTDNARVAKRADYEPTGQYRPLNATVHARPETATMRVSAPQKRGRKGDKITKALQAVPTTPVDVTTFMREHDVSLAVLRQSKRFIERLEPTMQAQIGKVNVRQDKTTKQLMIWREDTAAK